MNQTAKNIIAKLQEGLGNLNDVEGDDEFEPVQTVGVPGFPIAAPGLSPQLVVGPYTTPPTKVLTGKPARQRETDLHKRFLAKGEEAGDISLPFNRRARRRANQALAARGRRKGQRAYVRRELAKERAASDVANLFRIIDAGESHPFYWRADAAIEARVSYLLTEALKENPDSAVDEYEIEHQLRAVAATADTRLRGSARTKANRAERKARREKALANFAESQRIGHPVAQ